MRPAVSVSGERASEVAKPMEALYHVMSWEMATPLERAAFLQKMHGVLYSRRMVLIAWEWYRAGFDEARQPAKRIA